MMVASNEKIAQQRIRARWAQFFLGNIVATGLGGLVYFFYVDAKSQENATLKQRLSDKKEALEDKQKTLSSIEKELIEKKQELTKAEKNLEREKKEVEEKLKMGMSLSSLQTSYKNAYTLTFSLFGLAMQRLANHDEKEKEYANSLYQRYLDGLNTIDRLKKEKPGYELSEKELDNLTGEPDEETSPPQFT